MSWRSRIRREMEKKMNAPVNRSFIKHSIVGPVVMQSYAQTNYQQQAAIFLPATQQPPIRHATRTMWSKEELNQYYTELQKKGYRINARVRTNWGKLAKIKGYKQPDEAYTFAYSDAPNCILLEFEEKTIAAQNPYLLYNENELTLIEE